MVASALGFAGCASLITSAWLQTEGQDMVHHTGGTAGCPLGGMVLHLALQPRCCSGDSTSAASTGYSAKFAHLLTKLCVTDSVHVQGSWHLLLIWRSWRPWCQWARWPPSS